MQRNRPPYWPVMDWKQVAQGFQSNGIRSRGARRRTRLRELATHRTRETTRDTTLGFENRCGFIGARGLRLQRRSDQPVPMRLRELRQDRALVGNTKPLVLETGGTEGRQIDPGYNKARVRRGRVYWHNLKSRLGLLSQWGFPYAAPGIFASCSSSHR